MIAARARLAAVLLVAACDGGTPAVSRGDDCRTLRNCPPGQFCESESGRCLFSGPCRACDTERQLCVADVCRDRCNGNADCFAGWLCTAGACLPPAAEPEPEPEAESAADDEPEPEAEPEPESPCGDCPAGSVCYNFGAGPACATRCDLFAPACPAGTACRVTADPAVPGAGGALCGPERTGAAPGAPCADNNACRADLLCAGGVCRRPCDPARPTSCAPYGCFPSGIVDVGVCRPCADGADCGTGFACSSGVCVAGTACNASGACPGGLVCDAGVCVENCNSRSCPPHKPLCNAATGSCEPPACTVTCPPGRFCDNGRCAQPCNPPCTGRSYCTLRNNTSVCVEPPDCRLPGGAGCPPGTTCDPLTGYCQRRCPAGCPDGQCCDAASNYACVTRAACGAEFCSTANPTGRCRLGDEVCTDGVCRKDPAVCVADGGLCDGASKCCSRTAGGFPIQCCLDATNPSKPGRCCPAAALCIPVGLGGGDPTCFVSPF